MLLLMFRSEARLTFCPSLESVTHSLVCPFFKLFFGHFGLKLNIKALFKNDFQFHQFFTSLALTLLSFNFRLLV